jgi:CubicO group peptidase (beta-lactamase class C family)
MNKSKAIIVVLCLFLFLQTALAQPSKAKQIDAYITPFAKANQFSGVVLASENGKVIYEKAFGLANADFKIPNQLNTRIGIASITKLMTVVILNRLVEEKKIAPEDKLSKYIPDFPNGEKITIQMLRSHRSGILHRVMPPEQETVPYTSAEFVDKVKQSKLAFEPDTQRLYSSGGYAVLARALEIASGRSYAQLLQQYVFDPAGMKDSLEFDSYAIMDRRAQDYLLDTDGYINAPLKDYSFLVGAGSVFSTAHDVYRFAEAVLDGKYGEQVKTDWVTGATTLSGSGSTNGHRSYFEIEKDKKYGYVIISNLGSGVFDAISTSVTEILQGKELSLKSVTVPKIIPNPNKDLTEFLGRYDRQGGGGSVEVVIRNKVLYAGDIKLNPTGVDKFFEYKFFGDVTFVRDASGRIKQVEWVSPGVRSTWVRQ